MGSDRSASPTSNCIKTARRAFSAGPFFVCVGSASLETSRRHLPGALIRHEFVFDFLTILEFSQAGLFDRTDMNKDVLATSIRLDESKALGRIEPLHCPGRHDDLLKVAPSSVSCAISMSRLFASRALQFEATRRRVVFHC